MLEGRVSGDFAVGIPPDDQRLIFAVSNWRTIARWTTTESRMERVSTLFFDSEETDAVKRYFSCAHRLRTYH